MCKMNDNSQYYIEAEFLLRTLGIKKNMPGHELLKRAIVNVKVYKNISKEKLFKNVTEGVVIPIKDLPETKREPVEQLMIEAIRNEGYDDISVYDFVKKAANRIA